MEKKFTLDEVFNVAFETCGPIIERFDRVCRTEDGKLLFHIDAYDAVWITFMKQNMILTPVRDGVEIFTETYKTIDRNDEDLLHESSKTVKTLRGVKGEIKRRFKEHLED